MTKREKHYVKEIVLGLVMILFGVMTSIVLNGDVTALVFISLIATLNIIGNTYMLYYYRMRRRRAI